MSEQLEQDEVYLLLLNRYFNGENWGRRRYLSRAFNESVMMLTLHEDKGLSVVEEDEDCIVLKGPSRFCYQLADAFRAMDNMQAYVAENPAKLERLLADFHLNLPIEEPAQKPEKATVIPLDNKLT